VVCKTVGFRGALPRTPALPRRWGGAEGASPRPGRQSPTAEPPEQQGLALLVLRQTLAAPENPR
jgi:hypothetical protein